MSANRGSNEDGKGLHGVELERASTPQTLKIPSMTPSNKPAKHWAKQYRTEIAASTSSVFSTFMAVRLKNSYGMHDIIRS